MSFVYIHHLYYNKILKEVIYDFYLFYDEILYNKNMNKYFIGLIDTLKQIDKTQNKIMNKAAKVLAATVLQDGLIFTLGNGHSHSAALEGFHRSGSLACISAILDDSFNFRPSAHKATDLERKEGYILPILAKHKMCAKDTIIIISNSGRNAAGIDAAIYAKSKGLKVIVITAVKAHKETKSRHTSGKMLRDFADVLIDNCCNKQETVLKLNGKSAGPVSSLVSGAIMNSILFRTAEIIEKECPGFPLPFYKSSNDEGGDENNIRVAQKYKGRILFLE